MTSSHRNIFRITRHSSEFPSQRPMTWNFDVFFDLRLNKWLSKQWWGWRFETPSCSLWHNCDVLSFIYDQFDYQTRNYVKGKHGSQLLIYCILMHKWFVNTYITVRSSKTKSDILMWISQMAFYGAMNQLTFWLMAILAHIPTTTYVFWFLPPKIYQVDIGSLTINEIGAGTKLMWWKCRSSRWVLTDMYV